jgi:hypothetical protein
LAEGETVTNDLVAIFAQAPTTMRFGPEFVLSVLGIVTLIVVVAICSWTKAQGLRLDASLKQQMIDRGMSAADIVAVLTATSPGEDGIEPPCASEVVVESDGEWRTGLLLKCEEDRYLVHYVGTDMSENEWVTADRLRFPATSERLRCEARDWTFPVGVFGASGQSGFSAIIKPEAVDREI